MQDHRRSPSTWWWIAITVVASCRAPVSSSSRAVTGPTPLVASSDVLDLASDFVAGACHSEVGDAFARAWRAHEQRFEAVYRAFYYGDDGELEQRARLAAELGPRRDEMCAHARVFLALAPGVIASQRTRVAELIGARPASPVAFTAALEWTDGTVQSYRGRDYLVLNARHDSFARSADLVLTAAHELVHDAQTARFGSRDAALPAVTRALYREGAAVFAVQQLFPELARRAYGLRAEELERAERLVPSAAAELLALVRARAAAGDARRFFQGGIDDPLYPPKLGYVVGARVFAEVARARGSRAALQLSPEEFAATLEPILEALAATSMNAPR